MIVHFPISFTSPIPLITLYVKKVCLISDGVCLIRKKRKVRTKNKLEPTRKQGWNPKKVKEKQAEAEVVAS